MCATSFVGTAARRCRKRSSTRFVRSAPSSGWRTRPTGEISGLGRKPSGRSMGSSTVSETERAASRPYPRPREQRRGRPGRRRGPGLYDFIQSEDDDLVRLEIAQRARLGLQKREVIVPESIEIDVGFSDDTFRLRCSFQFADEEEPRELNVVISAVGVEVITT